MTLRLRKYGWLPMAGLMLCQPLAAGNAPSAARRVPGRAAAGLTLVTLGTGFYLTLRGGLNPHPAHAVSPPADGSAGTLPEVLPSPAWAPPALAGELPAGLRTLASTQVPVHLAPLPVMGPELPATPGVWTGPDPAPESRPGKLSRSARKKQNRQRSLKTLMLKAQEAYPAEHCPGNQLACPDCPGEPGPRAPEPAITPDWEKFGMKLSSAEDAEEHAHTARRLADELNYVVCRLVRRYHHPAETSSTHRKLILRRQMADARYQFGLLEDYHQYLLRLQATFRARLAEPDWEEPAEPAALPLRRRLERLDECLGTTGAAREKYAETQMGQVDHRLEEDARTKAKQAAKRAEAAARDQAKEDPEEEHIQAKGR